MRTGKRRPGDVEIVSGVQEHERVVVDGTQNVRDGSVVQESHRARRELTAMRISELSVRRPVFATVISMLLVIFGLVSLQRLSVREYPDIDRPIVSITTRTAARPPRSSRPRSRRSSRTPSRASKASSRSSPTARTSARRCASSSTSIATSTRPRTTCATASRASRRAADGGRPAAGREGRRECRLRRHARVRSDTMSMLELTDYAERNLVDRLSTVPGVARVSIVGGRRYAMRIWLDRQALAARQLTVDRHRGRAAPRERRAARRAGSSRARASSRCARWSGSRRSRTSATS